MCDNEAVGLLYETVLLEEKLKFQLTDDRLRDAIQNMSEVYKPDPRALSSDEVYVADYDDPAHRCAYLHKYAPLHTAMVADMFCSAVKKKIKIFEKFLGVHCPLNLCSLGGGPGADVLGVLSILNDIFDDVRANVTIVDYMEGWRYTFGALLEELSNDDMCSYGRMKEMSDSDRFQWQYLRSDLLGDMTESVMYALKIANIVTMVKFVSAAACVETFSMIKSIVYALQPGAIFLFIDNSGGGFHQLMENIANSFNMTALHGPLQHVEYKYYSSFSRKRFQCNPCRKTTITFHLWQKKYIPHVRDQSLDYLSNQRAQLNPYSVARRSRENRPHRQDNDSLEECCIIL